MNISRPFILRPVATALLMGALLLSGMLAYRLLPVSALPQVDYPTIVVTTQLPGASAETMASAVTTPLERQFGQIPSLAQMISVSSFGSSQITLQFSLERDIDAAEQDVQAAINEDTWIIGELVARDPSGPRVRLASPRRSYRKPDGAALSPRRSRAPASARAASPRRPLVGRDARPIVSASNRRSERFRTPA